MGREKYVGISFEMGGGVSLYKTQSRFARNIASRDVSPGADTWQYIDICLTRPIEESKLREMLETLQEELKDE